MTALEYIRAEGELPDRPVAQFTSLDLEPLVGTWYATDKVVTGATRLYVREQDGSLFVWIVGVDAGEPVDWGEVEAQPYEANGTSTSGLALTATFDLGFLITVVAGRLSDGQITLDTFNTFVDSSGRSNHFSRDFFHR